MKIDRITRRGFLQGSAAVAAAPYVITSAALGNADTPAASERVTLGHIGVGNRGRGLLGGFLQCKGVQSVAAADAYRDRRDAAAARMKGTAYADFRELLAREDIDGVVVATQDHWHVPIAIAAAKAGKDAYVEKPLGISVEQDLLCRKAFDENERIFQYGTQQRSSNHCRLGCELVLSGRLGKVHTLEVIAPNGGAGGSTDEAEIPETLDYDMWLGPAPEVPYTVQRCNPPGTYWIYDYSIGYLGGWGAHPLDIMVWGSNADLQGPMTFEGTGDIPTEGLYDTVHNWDVKVQMADGVNMTFKPGGDSTKFIGPDGWIDIRRGGITASDPEILKSEIGPDDVHLVNSPRQDQNFIDSIRSRDKAVSPVDHAVRSDIISHISDICIRKNRKVTWDPTKEVIVDDADASKMLSRAMRAPWTL